MEADHARADASSGQQGDALNKTVTIPETPCMLAPNLDEQANVGTKSTLLHGLDGACVSAKDPLFQRMDLSTKGVKRERPSLSTQLQDGAEALKRRSPRALVGLQKTVALAVLKAGEEWNASICANKTIQEGLQDRIEAGERRETALLEVQRDLSETIDALKEEVTALRQERRALISKTDAQEEMERELLNEHQKVLDEFGAEKECLAKLLQESKREAGVRKEREMVLLQERQALIDEIRALQQEKKQSSSKSTVKGKQKIEQVEVEVMIPDRQKRRKSLFDLVFGRTEVASEAAADETQTMEQQRATAPELQASRGNRSSCAPSSEQRKVTRTRMKPQRFSP